MAFLFAREAERERRAQVAERLMANGDNAAAFYCANAPDFVLADVAAKRQLIGWEFGWFLRGHSRHAEGTLRLLALSYADHPDYREEWRP